MGELHHIGNLLSSGSIGSTAPTTSGTRAATLPPMDESLMARLFASLAAEFGPRFAAQHASEETLRTVKLAWWVQVHDLTPEQIVRGLDAMTVGQDAWPPGPRAFRALCRAQGEPARTGAHVLFLPAPQPSPEARQAALMAIAGIRATLPESDPGPQPATAPVIPLADRRAAFLERHADTLRGLGLSRFIDGGAA